MTAKVRRRNTAWQTVRGPLRQLACTVSFACPKSEVSCPATALGLALLSDSLYKRADFNR
jgi:hypothetical protein